MADLEEKQFSGTFTLPAGEMLLVSAELAEQLGDLIGMSYRDIRSAMGVKARGGKDAPKMTMTDEGFAVISAIGPVTRYDDWCAWLFGGVSVDSLMDQLQAADADPACRGVLWFADGPGGQAAAIHDLSDMIYQMRDTTPVVAYVDNLAASATYWPVSAANKVVISPATMLGSIGVVTTVRKKSGNDNTMEIVSSKSPRKRVDVETDEGRAQYQSTVDALADVFIGQVAKYRGVDAAKVESDFGQGGVLIGQAAVDAGMADMVGDSGAAFAALRELADRSASDQNRYGRFGSATLGSRSDRSDRTDIKLVEAGMDIKTVDQLRAAFPELVATIMAEAEAKASTASAVASTTAASTERDRIKSISALNTAANRAVAGEAIDAAMWDGKTSASDLALTILTKSGEKTAAQAAARAADGAAVPVDRSGGGAGDEGGEEAERQALVASMAATVNGRRGVSAKKS